MCVSKRVFLDLCELFPVTAENLRFISLQRRQFFLKGMDALDCVSSFKALSKNQRPPLQSVSLECKEDGEGYQKSEDRSFEKSRKESFNDNNTISDNYLDEELAD